MAAAPGGTGGRTAPPRWRGRPGHPRAAGRAAPPGTAPATTAATAWPSGLRMGLGGGEDQPAGLSGQRSASLPVYDRGCRLARRPSRDFFSMLAPLVPYQLCDLHAGRFCERTMRWILFQINSKKSNHYSKKIQKYSKKEKRNPVKWTPKLLFQKSRDFPLRVALFGILALIPSREAMLQNNTNFTKQLFRKDFASGECRVSPKNPRRSGVGENQSGTTEDESERGHHHHSWP